jgi:hypothetical protein
MYSLATWFVSGICVDTLHKGENDDDGDDNDNDDDNNNNNNNNNNAKTVGRAVYGVGLRPLDC